MVVVHDYHEQDHNTPNTTNLDSGQRIKAPHPKLTKLSSSSTALLTKAQITFFETHGYLRIPSVFSREVASEVERTVINMAAQESGHSEPNLNTLKKKPAFIDGFYRPGSRIDGALAKQLNTEKLFHALDELLGKSNYQVSDLESHGLFTMTFPGFSHKPWAPPKHSGSWHIDNGVRFEDTYTLETSRCACVPVFLITDVKPEGGATACIPGSHKVMAALLKRSGGINYSEMRAVCEALANTSKRIDLLAGNAGDLVVMHPFLVHSPSANSEKSLRIMSNTGLGLTRGRNYDPVSTLLNPSEAAIVEQVYGLRPKHLYRTRLALTLMTYLRPLYKWSSGYPSLTLKRGRVLRSVTALITGMQNQLLRVACQRYRLDKFQ